MATSKTSSARSECVYYWMGGQWKMAAPWLALSSQPKQTVAEMRQEIERMGYRCVTGDARIGPPDGAPR